MPIAPEYRHFYRTDQWFEARAKVLERANGKCEFCGKPARAWVMVTRDGTGRWNRVILETLLAGGSVLNYLAAEIRKQVDELRGRGSKAAREAWWRGWWQGKGPYPATAPETGYVYVIRCVLTCAHLDHDPSNNDVERNLRALCQRCHLAWDAGHHRMTRATAKDRKRPLLAGIEWLAVNESADVERVSQGDK